MPSKSVNFDVFLKKHAVATFMCMGRWAMVWVNLLELCLSRTFGLPMVEVNTDCGDYFKLDMLSFLEVVEIFVDCGFVKTLEFGVLTFISNIHKITT